MKAKVKSSLHVRPAMLSVLDLDFIFHKFLFYFSHMICPLTQIVKRKRVSEESLGSSADRRGCAYSAVLSGDKGWLHKAQIDVLREEALVLLRSICFRHNCVKKSRKLNARDALSWQYQKTSLSVQRKKKPASKKSLRFT